VGDIGGHQPKRWESNPAALVLERDNRNLSTLLTSS
jgi:hypothetical protein